MTPLDVALIGCCALLATFAVNPLAIRHANGSGHFLDVPSHRSSHSTPTPRVGGVACLVGVAVGTMVAALTGSAVPAWWLIPAVLLGLIGVADDISSLPAAVRLLAQLILGVGLGLALGGPWWWPLLAALVTAWAVNVVNFMDGVNGMTCLALAGWGATALVLGSVHSVWPLSFSGLLTLALCLGCLPWNVPRAKLFLGDGGSYLLGGVWATGLLIGWSSGIRWELLVAPLLVYVVDTSATIVVRLCRGARIWEAHREHVYQRLVHAHQLSHTSVSVLAVLLGGTATAAFAVLGRGPGLGVAVVLAVGYLALPRIRAKR